MKSNKFFHFTNIFIFLFTSAVAAQSTSSQKARLKEKLKYDKFAPEITAYTFYPFSRAGSTQALPTPMPYGFTFRWMALEIDGSWYDARATTKLLYYYNQSPITLQQTTYNYTIWSSSISILVNLKSFTIGDNVCLAGAGVDLRDITVLPVDLNRLDPSLASQSTSFQMGQLGGQRVISAVGFVNRYFWIHNKEFFVRLKCYVPVSYKFDDGDNYLGFKKFAYNAKIPTWAELSIHFNLLHTHRFNPAKLHYL